jgi:hypothetical protein
MTRWPVMLSSNGSRGTCIPRGLLTFLPCTFTAHHAFLEGEKALEISPRKSTPRTLK